MSKVWQARDIGMAASIRGWRELGDAARRGGGFRALYSEEQVSRPWNVTSPAEPTRAEPAEETVDPIEAAAREAFVQGFQEGERLTREAADRDNAARLALAEAIGLVAQAGEGTLAALLSEAVIRLVTQIIGEAPIDAATLQARCAAVAACIDSDEARAVIEVNPEDLPLLEMEHVGVALAPNADLPRGSVRLATSDGWVEDGPDVRLSRLKAMMDDMEGRL